jgi:DNA repair protein RecO (recombination protein O)
MLNGYPTFRENYQRYIASSLCTEQLLLWTKEQDSDEELFRLILWAFEELESGADQAQTVIFFQVKLLDLLGYRPHLTNCQKCGILSAQAAPYRFSLARSGLACNRCNREPATNPSISIQTVQLLRKVQELEPGKLGRIKFSPAATAEAFGLLKKYTGSLLGRELSSWNFLIS